MLPLKRYFSCIIVKDNLLFIAKLIMVRTKDYQINVMQRVLAAETLMMSGRWRGSVAKQSVVPILELNGTE